MKNIAVIIAVLIVLLVVGAVALRERRENASNPPRAMFVPLLKPPPKAHCATMFDQLFQVMPSFLVELPLGEACTEIAIVDTGWWPTADPYDIWLEWNADKGAASPPRSKLVGPYDAKVQGVSGKWVHSKTTLWDLPSLPIKTSKGTVNVTGPGPQSIKLANGSMARTSGPVAMTGQYKGTGNTSVGGAFPRSLLTYDFVSSFCSVLSYNSSVMGLYSGSSIKSSYNAAKRHFPHLGPLSTKSTSGTSWGLMVELTLKVGGKHIKAMFLVDTGAVGITIMVTKDFGPKLECYDPVLYDKTTGITGTTCAPMKRACVVDSFGTEVCVPVDVEGVITGCPGCAGRVGTAFLSLMDIFLARHGGKIGSAYAFVAHPAALKAYECAQIKTQCPAPCAGTASCEGPSTVSVASICPQAKCAPNVTAPRDPSPVKDLSQRGVGGIR